MTLSIPTTRATTAYGYLTAIAKLSLQEPKRMRMGIVIARGEAGLQRLQEYATYDKVTGKVKKFPTPSCGTVGCVAGWAMTLAGQTHDGLFQNSCLNLYSAQNLLGLTSAQSDELFIPMSLVQAKHQQTKAHALKVVKHIKAFQQKYAAQLKATKITKQQPAQA